MRRRKCFLRALTFCTCLAPAMTLSAAEQTVLNGGAPMESLVEGMFTLGFAALIGVGAIGWFVWKRPSS